MVTVTPSALAPAEEAFAASPAGVLPVRRPHRAVHAAVLVALLAVQVCWLTALGYAVWLIA
jgi:hypothetical protein